MQISHSMQINLVMIRSIQSRSNEGLKMDTTFTSTWTDYVTWLQKNHPESLPDDLKPGSHGMDSIPGGDFPGDEGMGTFPGGNIPGDEGMGTLPGGNIPGDEGMGTLPGGHG